MLRSKKVSSGMRKEEMRGGAKGGIWVLYIMSAASALVGVGGVCKIRTRKGPLKCSVNKVYL